MVFGNTVEKNLEELSEKFEEMKNQRKLVELDLEKRMLLLGNSLNSVQKILGAIKDFEALKEMLLHMESVQGKLREIEDISLIARLETIQSDDKLAAVDDSVKELKEKLALISDAVEMLGDAHAKVSEGGAKQDAEETTSLKTDVASMKEAISKLASDIIPPQKISELSGEVEKIDGSIRTIEADFRNLAEAVREKLEMMGRSIETLEKEKSREISADITKEIGSMQNEINKLKNMTVQIVGQMEATAKKMQELKSLQQERQEFDYFKKTFEALQKDVLLLRKEMDLDRAMYPENLIKLERDMAAIKNMRKDAVTSADVQKIANDLKSLAKEFDSIKEQLPNYEESIRLLLQNNDSIKSGVADAVKTVKSALSENTELKKSIALIQQQMASLQGSHDEVAQKVGAQPAIPPEHSKLLAELGEKVGRLEELQNSNPHQPVEKLENDLRLLRREIANIKERLPEYEKLSALALDVDSLKSAVSDAIKIIESMGQGTNAKDAQIKPPINAKDSGALPAESLKRLGELEKTVLLLQKEMDLDRTMHPSNSAIKNVPEATAERQDSKALASMRSRTEQIEGELKEFRVVIDSLTRNVEQIAEDLKQICKDVAEIRHKQPIIID